jgi:hypothetical protein
MSAEAITPVTKTGEAFVQAIETAGAGPLDSRAHLDLLDEITEWLVRAHCAHDIIWNDYYTRAADRAASEHHNGTHPPATEGETEEPLEGGQPSHD